MMLAHLTIPTTSTWLAVAAAVIVLAVVMLWWGYRRVTGRGAVRSAAAALKWTGIALLAACLINPLWSSTRARPGANLFLILVDNSRSLQIHDHQADHPRGEDLRSTLTVPDSAAEDQHHWRNRLAQDFDVRGYLFDSRLKATDDFSELDFEGTGTALATSLKAVRKRFQDRPVAGVMLLTDGNATDLEDGALSPEGLPPVYPVVLGDASGLKDIRIDRVAVSQTAFEDAPVTIRADVAVRGFAEEPIHARLVDADGEVVQEAAQVAEAEEFSPTFRFECRPDKSGVSFYKLHVAPQDAQVSEQSPRVATRGLESREATLANNTRPIAVDRGPGSHRILYVSGRPNWEFKFLRRAIQADEQIDLVGLIRIADREPKFQFRGHVGESSNPLYRGFKKEGDAETERYDEPVLIRLNTKDPDELRGGFPEAAEDLFPFAAVILDDVESGFFRLEQMELLERFVSDRGGGFLMLGGAESLRRGDYEHTPVADLLPVYLDGRSASSDGEYRLALSRDGWLQPWMRLRQTEDAERDRLAEMPEFQVLNRVGRFKPGARVLARAVDQSGEQHPAVAVQRYGRGRSAVLTIGDLWRWQLRRTSPENDDQAKAWRQMLRWLVADVPQRVEVRVGSGTDNPAQSRRLNVRVRDRNFQPMDNATVNLTVHPPEGEAIDLQAQPSLDEAGLYETTFVCRKSGGYRLEASVVDGDGEPVGTARTAWVSHPTGREFRSITPNRRLLETLAEETGGATIAADRLDEFAASLPHRSVPITETWSWPLWHQSWVFALAIGCLIAEWGLRRWKGLP